MRDLIIYAGLTLFWSAGVQAREIPRYLSTPENSSCLSLVSREVVNTVPVESLTPVWGHKFLRDREVISFWNLLAWLEREGALPQIRDKYQVLNLCPGAGHENYALASFFGSGEFLVPGGDITVYSICRDTEAARLTQVMLQRRSAQQYQGLIHAPRFLQIDPDRRPDLTLLPEQVDFIILRHPSLASLSGEGWDPHLEQIMKRLRPEAAILITHNTEAGMRATVAQLDQLGITPEKIGRNRFSTTQMDQFFLVARR